MSDFEKAFPYILKHEGVYSDNPNDPGGPTKYGVSLRYLMSNKETGDINGDGVINADDIKNLTIAQAGVLYSDGFWKPNKLYQINDQAIATKALDMYVNMGPYAGRIIQRAINNILKNCLVVDGILGIKTFNAINLLKPKSLMTEICKECVEFYTSLVKEKPKLEVFLKGWLVRANSTCGL